MILNPSQKMGSLIGRMGQNYLMIMLIQKMVCHIHIRNMCSIINFCFFITFSFLFPSYPHVGVDDDMEDANAPPH